MKTGSYCKKSILLSILTAGFLLSVVFIPVYAAEGDPSAEQINAALKDLSSATGQNVATHEQAAQVCDSEKYLTICADIGKKYDLYKPEEIKKVEEFVSEIKGNIANQLQSCQTTECLIGVANNLANKLNTKKNSTLAVDFDLTPKLVEKKQAVITAAKELGVNYEQCRDMDPDTAPVELLRSCVKLAKDSRVKDIIPEEARKAAEDYGNYADKSVELRASLNSGEFQCGNGSLESCGNFCLNPGEAARAKGVAGIPPVCRQIAKKFFGADGEKQLESAYTQVGKTQQFIYKKAENILFTTIDGKTLTDPDAIGQYMEEQGKQGNVEAIEKGMDFMIAKGFVKPEEKEYVLKFVKQAKEKGGQVDFDRCSQDPESCREFIPQDHKAEFEASIKLQQVMKQELGFDPRECQNAINNQELGQKCFEASKKALPQLEGFAGQSTQVKQFVEEVRQSVARTEDFNRKRGEIQQAFQSKSGGPGGCKSEQECFAYCSDPSHGPECISFGAKQGVYRGTEAIERYQQFNKNIEQSNQQSQGLSTSQYGFPSQQGQQGFGQGGNFPGQQGGFGFPGQGYGVQGGFPGQGYGTQGGFPGGQGGFPEPGNFGGYPGPGGQGQFSGGPAGPSPECFAAIQSGDFVRAKTVCTVSIPTGAPFQPSATPVGPPATYPTYNPSTSGGYVSPQQCPSGSHWEFQTNACRQDEYPHPSGSYTPPPSCPSGQHWEYQANSCKPDYYPSPGSSYSPYPTYTSQPCSVGQWWDDYSHTCKPNTASYSPYPSGNYSPYPSPSGTPTSSGTCPSGAHIMYVNNAGGYCMSDSDASKCGPLNSTSVSSFGSCSAFQSTSPYPSSSYTPASSCPSGQWWDDYSHTCKSSTASYTPYPSTSYTYTPYPSPGTCPSGQYWYWPSTGAGYCKPNETPYPSGSYTPYPSTSYTPYPSGSYTPYPTYSSTPTTTVTSVSTSTTTTITTTTTTAYTPPPTTYSPQPTYSYSPPSCPSGQLWDEASHTCKVAANFVQQQIAMSNTIMSCLNSGGKWNAQTSSCLSKGGLFGNILKVFSKFFK